MSALPDDISTPDELGEAYKELRWVLATLQSDLGGGHFARSVTLRAVREAFSAVRERGSRDFIPFTECFSCTSFEMRAATQHLQQIFRLREEPVTHEAAVITQSGKREAGAGRPASPGRLVLRGATLYFKTAQAGVQLAHMHDIYARHGMPSPDPAGRSKWEVDWYDEVKVFTESFCGTAPKITVSYTKNRETAMKSLLRGVREYLAVDLQPVQG